jgi:hypothetical protein
MATTVQGTVPGAHHRRPGRVTAFLRGLLGGSVVYQFPAEDPAVFVSLDLGSGHLGIGVARVLDPDGNSVYLSSTAAA